MASPDKVLPSEMDEKPSPSTDIQALLQGFHAAASRIPQSEKDTLPNDLVENLDHYVYGSPKR